MSYFTRVTFTYDFNVTDQSGTYWYHSHMGSQYGDGLRGLFIIEYDNDDEYNKEFPYEYDEDVTLSVGDHYHLESPEIVKNFMTRFNPLVLNLYHKMDYLMKRKM